MAFDITKTSLGGAPTQSRFDINKTSLSTNKSKRYNDLYSQAGISTLESDLNSLGSLVDNAYAGWQNSATMAETKNKIADIQKRLKLYDEFKNTFGIEGADTSKIAQAYDAVLSDWDALSSRYAKYKNAAEYGKAVKESETAYKNNNKDLGLYDTEIKDLENKKTEAQVAFSNYNDFLYKSTVAGNNDDSKKFQAQADSYKRQYDEILAQYGFKNVNELEGEIQTLKANRKAAARYQEAGAIEKPVLEKVDIDIKGTYDSSYDNKDVDSRSLEKAYKYINGKDDSFASNIFLPVYDEDGSRLYTQPAVYYAWMDEKERKVFNYLFNTGKKEEAKKYLGVLNPFLENRAAEHLFSEYIKDNGFLETVTAIPVGLDQFATGIVNNFKIDDDYIEPSLTAKIGGMAREDLGDSFGGVTYDVLQTISNMAPSILASYATGLVAGPGAASWVGAGTMGASARGNAYAAAINSGMDKTQAHTYSTFVGVSEAALSKALSGISSLGGSLTNKSISAAVSGIENGFWRFAAKMGLKGTSEAIEESLQEILEPLFENIALGYNKNGFEDIDWSEVVYAGLMAFATTGIFETVPTARQTIAESKVFKDAKHNFPDAESQGYLIGEGIDLGGEAKRLAEQLKTKLDEGKALKGSQISQLIEANKEAIAKGDTIKIKTAVENRLKELGETSNVPAVADVITKQAVGEDLTRTERKTLADSKYGERVANEANPENVMSGEYASYWAQLIETDIVNAEAYNSAVNNDSDVANLNRLEQRIVETDDADLSLGERMFKQQIVARLQNQRNFRTKDALAPNKEAAQGENILASPEGEEAVDTKGLGFTAPNEKQIRRPLTYEEQIDEISGRKKTVQMRHILDLAKKLDSKLKVIFVPNNDGRLSGQKGMYDRDTNTMYLANDFSTIEGYAEVFKHEFVHRLELKKAYDGLKRYLFNKSVAFEEYAISRLQLHDGKIRDNRDDAINDLIQMYIDNFKNNKAIPQRIRDNFTREKAEKEAVADFIARTLFKGNTAQLRVALKTDTATLQAVETDLKLFEELARDDRNLLQKVIDAIKDFIASIKGIPQFRQLEEDLNYIEQRLSRVYNSRDVGKGESGVVFAKELNKDLNQEGLEYDEGSESAFSADSWEDSDYVKDRDATAKKLADALGISKKKALAYISDIDGIANTILADYARLGYVPSPDRSAFVSNAEYGGSIDMSTLCAKRRWLTGTFSAIQKALNHTALTANEILEIRNMLKAKGIEVSCGLCYVEGSRAQMGKFAKEFIERYKKRNPDWIPDMADVNTPEGVEQMRLNHPEAYEAYEQFWNNKGVLNEGEKNLFASQQKPKLYQLRTDYKHEILDKFSSEGNVVEKNRNGGMRIQSFSDFEIVHLIDMMQVIIDMSQVGLHGQAYTKVPEFALALGNTGLKINLSLIAKDVDADGNLVFDDVEGMPFKTAMNIRNMYSKNVGTVLVVFNDAQLKAALKDSRIDFVLPFHRSQWKRAMYEDLGLPSTTKDYTYVQNERYIKPVYYTTKNGTIGKRKATNYMPNEYWDFSKSGKENAENYLKMCAENNKRPKFYKLLVDNGNGSYSLRPDGSTDGYWKLLIDFKMYDNEGKGSKQTPVKPDFNMDECYKMLEAYEGGHEKFPVNQEVVDEFVGKYMKEHGEKGFKEKTKADANTPTSKYDFSFSSDDLGSANFQEDKYYARQIDKWQTLKDGSYITVGRLQKGSPLNMVGMPEGKMYFDVSKIKTELEKHGDHLDTTMLKGIPNLLANPIVITEYKEDNTISVYGQLYYHNTPVVIGVVATKGRGGNVITKIRTVHARGDLIKQITDDTVLYLNENKKETDKWFQAQGHRVPMRGTKYGFIRSITPKGELVNTSFSSDDLTATHRDLLDRYEKGEISKEEYLAEMDSIYGQAVEQYGAIEKGEYNETDMPVPQAVAEDKPNERFARTFVGAAKLTPEMANEFEKDVLLGKFTYKIVSDESAMKVAEDTVKSNEGEKSWKNLLEDGGFPTKNDIAIGEKLLTDAIAKGDTYNTLKYASELADIFTRAGQVVQAASMLGKMTGAGRLVGAQRFIDSVNKDRQKKYGDNVRKIKIDPKLAELLATAEGRRAIEQAYGEIMKDAAAQVEPTFLDKWNTWRYFAMLCNPRTHVRNITGNAIFLPAVRMKDVIGTGLERAFHVDGTKVVKVKKEYRDFAKRDVQTAAAKNFLKGQKYDDKSTFEQNRRTYKSDFLESLTGSVFNALEVEDMFAKNKHYVHALGSYLQAKKIDLNNVSDEVLTKAREYARNEAFKATFNDFNALANKISQLSKDSKVAGVIIEGILPFKRTPLNIIRRSVEYSPIGLATSLTKGFYDLSKGKITADQLIDGVASGVTGSIVFAIGCLFGALGWAGGTDDDEDKNWYERMLGGQDYAIKIGNHSYTVDWAAPSSIPFFIGVELAEAFEDEFSLNALWDSFGNALEPIINLSALSGVQETIESVRYAQGNEILTSALTDAATNYLLQSIPSPLGALGRTIDEKQRTWYVDKNSAVPEGVQEFVNNFKTKIPGLSYTMPEKIDAWGREVSRGGLGERIAENFVSPGYYSYKTYTDVEKEIEKLYDSTKLKAVLPSTAGKSFKVNNVEKNLTATEYVTYAKAKGQYSFDYVEEFINHKEYDSLNDEQKVAVIQSLYEYANAKAKTTVSEYDLMKTYKVVNLRERNGGSAVDYYIKNQKKK